MVLVNIGIEAVEMTDEEYAAHLAQLEILRQSEFRDFRRERNRRLQSCDWVFLSDSPIENKEQWIAYRQALRDLPETTTDPQNPVWPVEPT